MIDWIDVNERLPEMHNDVLLSLKFENGSSHIIIGCLSYSFYEKKTMLSIKYFGLDNHYLLLDDEKRGYPAPYEKDCSYKYKVTHWAEYKYPESYYDDEGALKLGKDFN